MNCISHTLCTCTFTHVGGRELLDVRSRLQMNSETQRLVAHEADYLQLEMMAQETQTKMKVLTCMYNVQYMCIIFRSRYAILLITAVYRERVREREGEREREREGERDRK